MKTVVIIIFAISVFVIGNAIYQSRTEMRKIIATWLTGMTINILPACDFKTKFAEFIVNNLNDL